MDIKLADALLRRKELEGKVTQLRAIKDKDLYETRGKRVKISDDLDDVILSVPLLSASQVTGEYDFYARQLRLIDSVIQQANWTTTVFVDDKAMADYVAPALERNKNAPGISR